MDTDNEQQKEAGGAWSSWIEMLLLKHPEDRVREGFQMLLLTAVKTCHKCEKPSPDIPSLAIGPSPADAHAAAGRNGAGAARASRRKSGALVGNVGARSAATLHANVADRGGGGDSRGQLEEQGRQLVEQLGRRLLEVAQTALNQWSKSTLSAALTIGVGSREKEKRQLHHYLLLLADLVVGPSDGCSSCRYSDAIDGASASYLSRDLVRQIGEVVLQLAIEKALVQPDVTKVLAEAWVKMLGTDAKPTALRDMVISDAFCKGSVLSVPYWTWLVEWLHRCSTNVDPPVKMQGESLPGAANAYYTLYLIRKRLLSQHEKEQGIKHEAAHFFRARTENQTLSKKACDAWRYQVLRLDVESAGHPHVNGAYLYTGYLVCRQRAVYTRVAGTKVYVLMAATEEPEPLPLAEAPLLKRRRADAAYQRWLLAECSYGVSWQNTEDSLEGMHCMVDAAQLADALASALASGDSGALARISKSGLRQILYTGRLDLPPATSRAAAGKSESFMQLCSRLHPFRVGSVLETMRKHSSYAAPPPTSVTGMKMVECPRDVMVENVRGGVSGASSTRDASTRSSRETSTRQATHTSAEEYWGEKEEEVVDPELVLVEELIDGVSSVSCVALLYSLLYAVLLYSLLCVVCSASLFACPRAC
jgi:hypothetical protein